MVFLMQLFNRNTEERMGMPGCPKGAIRGQPFFSAVDWDKIEKREIMPPFKPKIVSAFSFHEKLWAEVLVLKRLRRSLNS